MTIGGSYADATALTKFDTQLQEIFFQTKFRCERFMDRRPFGTDNKGKLMRVPRIFSEGLPVDLDERFSPIVPTRETKWDDRWISTKTKVSVEFVDDKDIQESFMDPTGELAKRQVEAFNRKLDIDAVTAMFAPVTVGPNEANLSTLAWSADMGTVIDMTGGATYQGLLAIKESLIDNEAINEGDGVNIFLSYDGVMNTQFMSEIELTSGDYTAEDTIDAGEIQKFAGIQGIRFGSGALVPDPILPVFGGVRTGFVCTNKGMRFYVQNELDTIVDRDPTRHQTWRIRTYMRYNFLRMDGRHVMKLLTTVS